MCLCSCTSLYFIKWMDWYQPAKMLKDLPREALLRPLTRTEVVSMLLRLTIFGAATYYSIKWIVEAMDPTAKQKSQAKKRVFVLFSFLNQNQMCYFKNIWTNVLPGRTAYEEDWCWGRQTHWIWDEHRITTSGSTNNEGNGYNPYKSRMKTLKASIK